MTTEQKTFIENIAAAARKHAANYGIAVISPIIAQAINESGWGKSTLAAKYQNYFGMKCGSAWKGKSVNMSTCEEYEVGVLTQIKDNFRVYDSLEEGVKGYFDFISASRYANLKGVTDPKTYIENIKADGYATSSQYVKNLLNLVSAYNLTQYDNITAQQGKKSVAEIAQEVIAGAWGNGTERKEKLEAAGAVIVGKTNMDEFAMGSTTETSYYGETKNPWDLARVPGGSSGGSAAAVAAEEIPYALGSDTGGSIRQPAAFCGVTGIKPTYGRVSRYGLIAYGSSLDQIGPLAKDVTDCATILEAICKHDDKDSTSYAQAEDDFTSALVDDVKGMKIGIPRDYFAEGIDEDVKTAVLAAAKKLEEKGAIVEEFDLGMVEYAIPAYYIIASAEASSNLERFDGVKYGYRTAEYRDLHNMYKKTRSEGFGAEVKRRIMLGSFVLSSGYYDAYYVKALKTKALIKKAFDDAFAKYDVILGPVAPTTALKMGESLSDPIKMYLGDIYTVSVNLAGLPGISLPCGQDKDGMPVGMQLLGQTFDEESIIRAAYAFECTKTYKRPDALGTVEAERGLV